jgi:aryl-alcohol dehydrogenase-like predicted oxidoreductase
MDLVAVDDGLVPVVGPRDLGGTGVMVSPVSLDGASFGWSAGIDETLRVLDGYLAGGGNLISTADHYAGGRSEIMIGSWLRTVPDRASVVLETRVGRHPDAAGLGRLSLLRAVENSLTRLGTDYVDFLSFDGEDPGTPIEESLETGYRLISEGKVRFLSASGFTGEAVREVERLSEESGGPRFRALLTEYNLMERAFYERELEDIAVEMQRGALARFPLANGYLTGLFRTRDAEPGSIMYDDAIKHVGRRGDRVLAALDAVGKELQVPASRVALAWVLLRPGVASAVLRAGDATQITDALEAVNVRLARHHVALLNRASEI